MKYNTHKFSPRTAARKSALKLDKDKKRYSATLKNLDTATRNLNVLNDVDNNIISNQSSGIINESNNVVSSPPQPTSSQTIQPTAAVTQMPTNNNTVNRYDSFTTAPPQTNYCYYYELRIVIYINDRNGI